MLLGAIEGGEARFFLHDHLGSVRAVADMAGKVIERRDYDPFGTPARADRGGLAPGFAGLFQDADAGLYLSRSRASPSTATSASSYSPGTGVTSICRRSTSTTS